MGKKRTHAETKDGFTKPPADKNRVSVKNDSKDKGKTGNVQKPRSQLLFKPQPEWHSVQLPSLPTVDNPTIPPRYVIDAIREYAEQLLEAEATEYASSHMAKDSSHKFMSTVMNSGTMEDKVSALTLLVQESPLHTMKAFGQLLGLSQKKNRGAAMMSLAALKDLLGQGVLLPPDRKLKAFARQPGLISSLQGKGAQWKAGEKLPGDLQKIHLIVWAYEDWLKKQYFEMLKILETWSNDEIEYSRNRAVTMVWELLKEKPEQEENLLRLLINKLGDKEKKVASRASYLLLQLQITHPLMKNVIISSIESDLLFRPNQSGVAKYYAVITMNQTVLSVKEPEVANRLLEMYFSLFLGLLKKQKEHEKEEKRINKHGLLQGGGGQPGKMAKKKAEKAETMAFKVEDESREKLISAILTGVNRAFPFAKTDDAKFEEQLNMIFEVTHSSNFNTSIQAMTLIQQISATKHYSADRFYRTLYESLLDPRLISTSKHIMFLNLLYRSLKADTSVKRVKAFVKRLLQIIHLHEPPFICGVLYLVNELFTTFPTIKSMLSTPEDNAEDDGEEHYEDAAEDGEKQTSKEETKSEHATYDARKRDPEHAQADLSCLWELLPLQAHYHPSVHVLASKIVNQEPIKEKPDPTIYTLMNFLDKFSFRNAKTKIQAVHGSSIMQPMSGTSKAASYLITARDGDRTHDPLNSESFWRQKIDDVRVDEVFFHTYFEKAGKAKQADKKSKKKDKRKGDDSEDESGEDEIWQAIVNSRRDVEGDGGDDDDLSDFDMDDMMSDEEAGGMDAGVELNLGSDDDATEVDGQPADDDDEDDFENFDLDDEDGFVDSDADVPVDFDMNDDTDVDEDKKDTDKDGRKSKKRKLKNLPTFASVEDYAKLIGDDDSE
ncbi:CBF-domain-containing protein [Cucurbitaria berberidis CBS 394.84]|uniref:CBF-domain-containing protein n=1 Tax=Cucurbitaria berberidis CBS 394.84 TaxID=1168544 RepID=A0A9P4G837_9PLEO|nr:CBF-domain-containing protein [Cucurbitaria berberidis CBS 394.84]KAF1840734.1 CBF-domain-containing protein [Cucurbitaria berberidis CBS 394.84]